MNTNNSNGNSSSKSSTGRRGSNKGATAKGAEAATSQAHVETVAPPANEIEVVASTNENVEGNVSEMNATNVLSEETVSSASVIETSTNENEGTVNAMEEATTTTTTIETATTSNDDNATSVLANVVLPEASNDESADIVAASLVAPNDEPVIEVVELTPVDRVLVGVNMDNAVLKGLTASKESLVSKLALARAQVAEYEAAMATTEEQIAAESKGGNLEGKAREAAAQMLNFFSEEAVHAALIKQYGAIRGVSSAVAKHAESGGSGGATTAAGTPRLRNPAQVTKKVTLSIGAREQKKILDKVIAMGDKGARMEDLVTELGIDQVQILGTLKNGIFDGKLRKDGASRGMRYFATKDAAPAPTAPSTAAE